MLHYLKKYPFSLFIVLVVIYLSFFRPPQTEISKIPNMDKVVHMGMYFGMSLCLWFEFLRTHKKHFTIRRVFIGAFFLPVLFSGCVELLQEYCTSYRGGDWLDFTANTCGAFLAGLVGYYILKPRMFKQ